jgi:TetR/AcrR family transcriptional repressor of nem operon
MKDFTELSPSAERIVDAAEGLIQTLGYNGFSYEDVAQIVGIRKPSIHHHFPGKADLGAVVAQRYTRRFMEKLNTIWHNESSAQRRLRAYAQLFEKTYQEDRRLCVCGMLGAESDSLPPEVSEAVRLFFEKNLHWLASTLREGASSQQIKLAGSAEATAELLLSALEGSMLLGRGRQIKRGPEQVMKTLFSSMWA